MFARQSLNVKIITGYLVLVVFVLVTGYVGYRGICALRDALVVVGDEEAPVVEQASEMKQSLLIARNAMEEFKSASSALASDDEKALKGIEANYQKSLADFDRAADAIVNGAKFENGEQVVATDNQELASEIRKADTIHNNKFQKSCREMMQAGHDLLVKQASRMKAMEGMEKQCAEIIGDAGNIEALIGREVARRRKQCKNMSDLDKVMAEEVPLADVANEIKVTIAETRIALEEYVQATDKEELDAIMVRYGQRIKTFDRLVKTILEGGVVDETRVPPTDNPQIIAAAKELDKNHTAFQNAATAVINAQNDMIKQAAVAESKMAALDEYGGEAETAINEVAKLARTEMSKAKENGREAVKSSVTVMVLTVVIAALAGCFIGFAVARSISKPINVAVDGMSRGAEQVLGASTQVSASSQDMAEGASEQAASLEEISSSLEEMSSVTQQNADHAKEADTMASEAAGAAQKGESAMVKMTEAIGLIKGSSDETAKIIKTIDEIAFQTNLLALNAAVEAARAGEAGKGFAVVAEEVRNLAQRSAEAAKSTAALIETSCENSENGVKAAGEVSGLLSEIVQKIQTVASLVAQVNAASSEQNKGISQINEAVNQLDQLTQSNAANAEESASASEELNAQADELQGIVGTLVMIVEGHNAGGRLTQRGPGRVRQVSMPTRREIAGSRKPASPKSSPKTEAIVTPENVIPLDDSDFSDF